MSLTHGQLHFESITRCYLQPYRHDRLKQGQRQASNWKATAWKEDSSRKNSVFLLFSGDRLATGFTTAWEGGNLTYMALVDVENVLLACRSDWLAMAWIAPNRKPVHCDRLKFKNNRLQIGFQQPEGNTGRARSDACCLRCFDLLPEGLSNFQELSNFLLLYVDGAALK